VPARSALAWRERYLGRRPPDQGALRSQAARACWRISITKTSRISSFNSSAQPSHGVGCHPSSQKCRHQVLTYPRTASMTSGHRRAVVPSTVWERALSAGPSRCVKEILRSCTPAVRGTMPRHAWTKIVRCASVVHPSKAPLDLVNLVEI